MFFPQLLVNRLHILIWDLLNITCKWFIFFYLYNFTFFSARTLWRQLSIFLVKVNSLIQTTKVTSLELILGIYTKYEYGRSHDLVSLVHYKVEKILCGDIRFI